MQDERTGSDSKDGVDPRRRAALKAAARLGIGLSLAPAFALAQSDGSAVRPQVGDWLVRVDDPAKTPLTSSDISTGVPQTMAWAMDPGSMTVRSGSRLNRLVLMRFDAASLSETTRTLAADGVVAYTAICTHNGCEVTDWLNDEQLLSCPCHQTKFDPKGEGRVIEGAAPRPLPALPLAVSDGKLVVAKPFTSRVGFDPA